MALAGSVYGFIISSCGFPPYLSLDWNKQTRNWATDQWLERRVGFDFVLVLEDLNV